MKRIVKGSLLLLSLCLAPKSFAFKGGPPPGPREECEKLKPTPEQEEVMHADRLANAEKRVDLESAIKKARINFEKVASNEKSDAKAIHAAAEKVAEAVSAMITAEELGKADLLAKMVKPKDRALALRCFMGLERRGPGFEHQGFEGHHGFGGPRGPRPKGPRPEGPRGEEHEQEPDAE